MLLVVEGGAHTPCAYSEQLQGQAAICYIGPICPQTFIQQPLRVKDFRSFPGQQIVTVLGVFIYK